MFNSVIRINITPIHKCSRGGILLAKNRAMWIYAPVRHNLSREQTSGDGQVIGVIFSCAYAVLSIGFDFLCFILSSVFPLFNFITDASSDRISFRSNVITNFLSLICHSSSSGLSTIPCITGSIFGCIRPLFYLIFDFVS